MVATPRNLRCVRYEEYHPFGTTSWWATDGGTEVSAKRYRYTGKERDEETGLSYHGARFYAAWLGRWERPDPIGLAAGIDRYVYASCNPVGRLDPSGEQDLDASVDQRVDDTPSAPPAGGMEDGQGAVRSPDVVVIITGGVSEHGQEMAAEDALGSGAMAKKFQEKYSSFKDSGRYNDVIIAPALRDDSTIETSKAFVLEHGASDSRVLIEGFSRGGDAAVDLADALQAEGIKVDLLVTVDSAFGPLSKPNPLSPVDRSIPPNVTTNMNYFQTTPSSIGSRGYPNAPEDPTATAVYNIEVQRTTLSGTT